MIFPAIWFLLFNTRMYAGDYLKPFSKSRPLSAMKILHALVGYLTVTALPFSLFAFAHPLAASIDHDGFVNTRQIQNDGDLMKRKPGHIIEARQLVVVPVVIIFSIVTLVTTSLDLVHEAKRVRSNEEEFLVDYFD
jgi:hypothetical protein